MTRFDEATECPEKMAVIIAFCIAGYLEKKEVMFFTEDALTEFMTETSEVIVKWLCEERKVSE